MNDFSHFESTITKAVWKQQCTYSNNLICGEIDCYSTCHIDYKFSISLVVKGLFGLLCSKCKHNLRNHHRCRAIWEGIIDKQVLVDENMKKKWEAAKDGKEKTEALIAGHEKVLNELNQVTERATNELAQLVEDHAQLALSGNFSAPVASAIRLLEENYVVLERKGIAGNRLRKEKESLDLLKRKLELLNDRRRAEGGLR